MSGTFVGIDSAYLAPLLECSPRAVKIALAMAARHNGRNNGAIPFAIRDAIDATKSTSRLVCEAMKQLQDKGLIECTRQASFNLKTAARGRQAREWKLNFVWERKK